MLTIAFKHNYQMIIWTLETFSYILSDRVVVVELYYMIYMIISISSIDTYRDIFKLLIVNLSATRILLLFGCTTVLYLFLFYIDL